MLSSPLANILQQQLFSQVQSTKYRVQSTESIVQSTEDKVQSIEQLLQSMLRFCRDSKDTMKVARDTVLSAKGTQLPPTYQGHFLLFAVSLLNKGVSSILPSAEFRDRNLNNDNFLISPTKRLKTVRGSQQTRKMVTMQINNQQHLQWHQHLYQAVSSRDATKTHQPSCHIPSSLILTDILIGFKTTILQQNVNVRVTGAFYRV